MADLNTQNPADRVAMTKALGVDGLLQVVKYAALDTWFAAYSDAPFATAFINWVGDSLTFGQMDEAGDTAVASIQNATRDPLSAPGQLASMFAREFGTNYSGAITPTFTGIDSRVTLSGGNSITPGASTGPLGMVGQAASNGAYAEFAVPACKQIDALFYNNNSGPNTGAFQYQVDGGGAVSVPLAAPFGANKVVSASGLSSASHTFRLTRTDASNTNYWQGVRYHDGIGVCVSRYGRPGWTSSDLLGIGGRNSAAVGNAAAQARLALGVHAGSPALTIIAIGHNDWGLQISEATTPAVYKANLQAIIDRAPGSVLLVSTPLPPIETTPVGGVPLSSYWTAARDLALANANVAHVQLGDIFTPASGARGVTLGYNAGPTTIHQSRKGYGAWARAIHGVLTGRFAPVR
jgi:lysophospholipase L1-like esterase